MVHQTGHLSAKAHVPSALCGGLLVLVAEFVFACMDTAGHFLLTSAYRFAPASMLVPFNYFHIAFAVILGWLVYTHVPDGWALTGTSMITISGAAIAVHTHLSKPIAKDS